MEDGRLGGGHCVARNSNMIKVAFSASLPPQYRAASHIDLAINS